MHDKGTVHVLVCDIRYTCTSSYCDVQGRDGIRWARMQVLTCDIKTDTSIYVQKSMGVNHGDLLDMHGMQCACSHAAMRHASSHLLMVEERTQPELRHTLLICTNGT